MLSKRSAVSGDENGSRYKVKICFCFHNTERIWKPFFMVVNIICTHSCSILNTTVKSHTPFPLPQWLPSHRSFGLIQNNNKQKTNKQKNKTKQQQFYYYLYKKIYVCPANSQKASHGVASRYKNNFNKNKLSCKPWTEINRINNIQKLNEVNTALTEEQCMMKWKEDKKIRYQVVF